VTLSASLRELSSRSPSWHIKASTDLRQGKHVPRPFHTCRRPTPPSRRSLLSIGNNRLVVHTSRLSTVGSRGFPVTGPQTWNDLPEDVASAESLATFRLLLKTHLFKKSFPDYLLDINWLSLVVLAVVLLLRSPKSILIDWLIEITVDGRKGQLWSGREGQCHVCGLCDQPARLFSKSLLSVVHLQIASFQSAAPCKLCAPAIFGASGP